MKTIIFILAFILWVSLYLFLSLYRWPATTNFSSNEIKTNNNLDSTKEVEYSEAYFAWGCFWCIESIMDAQDGVKEAISWYLWGTQENAKYDTVSTWETNHREWVKVIYNPEIISYSDLTKIFFRQIDPTDPDWQFADRWFQYTTAIFYTNDQEKNVAESIKKELEDSKKFDKPIVTSIIPFTTFFEAEEYHQDYSKKNSLRYWLYAKWSGREWYKEEVWSDYEFSSDSLYQDYSEEKLKNATEKYIVLFFHADWCPTCRAFEETVLKQEIPKDILILKVNFDKETALKQKYNILTQTSFVIVDNDWNMKKRWIWSRWIEDIIEKVDELKSESSISNQKTYTKEELKSMLTPMQYKVTQEWWTEPPFDNEYWDNHEEGIYVDVIDWTPLFSSTDKFDSWTWWPSFTKPIDENFITEEEDNSFFMKRTEIKSWESHLWHVFDDWPKDAWWLRYCINSAALRFVPKEDMEKEWYSKYLVLFK